jgi:hypothetical protein
MSRAHRYETYIEERQRTIEQLACDNCGTLVDTEPLKRPEGWTTILRQIDGKHASYDFHEWDCVIGWVNAQDDPGSYIEDWQKSIDQIAEERADAILAEVE